MPGSGSGNVGGRGEGGAGIKKGLFASNASVCLCFEHTLVL